MDLSHILCFTDSFFKSKSKRKALDIIYHKYPQCNAPQEVPYFFKESGIERKSCYYIIFHCEYKPREGGKKAFLKASVSSTNQYVILSV